MKWKIVTDSSCDLRELNDIAEGVTYSQVPFKMSLGDTHYTDDKNLDIKTFMDSMSSFKGAAVSACPSPDEWFKEFEDADYVFAVTITSGLSGSFNSAKVAKDMILEKYPDKKIFLIDSLSTGPSPVLLVRKLNELIRTYNNFDKIREEITSYFKKVHTTFTLSCLDNLVKNGRVSKLVAAISSVLNISLVGRASTIGTLEVINKSRGSAKAYQAMIKEMHNKKCSGSKFVICHCFNETGANDFATVIRNEFPNADISILPTSGLDSFYAEKNGMIIAFEGV